VITYITKVTLVKDNQLCTSFTADLELTRPPDSKP